MAKYMVLLMHCVMQNRKFDWISYHTNFSWISKMIQYVEYWKNKPEYWIWLVYKLNGNSKIIQISLSKGNIQH